MVFATMFLLFLLQLDNSIFTTSTNNSVRFCIAFLFRLLICEVKFFIVSCFCICKCNTFYWICNTFVKIFTKKNTPAVCRGITHKQKTEMKRCVKVVNRLFPSKQMRQQLSTLISFGCAVLPPHDSLRLNSQLI